MFLNIRIKVKSDPKHKDKYNIPKDEDKYQHDNISKDKDKYRQLLTFS